MRSQCTVLLLILLIGVVFCDKEKDAFCKFLEAKDRNEEKKVEFMPLGKIILGYVGKWKMIATKPIKTGEVIYSYSVDQDAISIEKAFQDPTVGPIFQALSKSEQEKRNETNAEYSLFDDQIIKLYLIYLKHYPTPEWEPYIEALPTSFGTPLYWTDSELDELEGTTLHTSALRWKKSIEKDFEHVAKLNEKYPDIFDNEVLLNATYFWSYSVYQGRLWYKSTKHFNPLFPLIELFNYKVEASARVMVDDTTDEVSIIALEDIEKGEEIFFNDQPLPNADLLEYYGFILPNNKADQVTVGVGLRDQDKLMTNKRGFFKRRGIKDGQTFAIKINDIPDDLIFALRVYHLGMYDYDNIENAFKNQPISHQNEMSVIESLIEVCRAKLKLYPTTSKQDKAILKDENLPLRKRKAVMLRRSEKKILLRTLEVAKKNMERLKADWGNREFDLPDSSEINLREIM